MFEKIKMQIKRHETEIDKPEVMMRARKIEIIKKEKEVKAKHREIREWDSYSSGAQNYDWQDPVSRKKLAVIKLREEINSLEKDIENLLEYVNKEKF